jgi:haloacetate dehalogenase
MTSLDLYPGFETRQIETTDGEIFARVGGQGPPLLLLHGFPQTHVCWHRVAGELARHARLVIPDLRGYGQSACLPDDDGHVAYSKRAMAAEMREVMKVLGHARFAVAGHDRGGRVAYRLALDHPGSVTSCLLLDILPTSEVWARLRAEQARGSYHWTFLSQPAPMPETLISCEPAFYVRHTLASWTKDKTLDCFDARALAAYQYALSVPERVAAVCADYRAGATIDRALDEADRVAGRTITCPTTVLWGSDYVGKSTSGATPLDVWEAWAPGVTGQAIDSGHFLAEENPRDTLDAMIRLIAALPKA